MSKEKLSKMGDKIKSLLKPDPLKPNSNLKQTLVVGGAITILVVCIYIVYSLLHVDRREGFSKAKPQANVEKIYSQDFDEKDNRTAVQHLQASNRDLKTEKEQLSKELVQLKSQLKTQTNLSNDRYEDLLRKISQNEKAINNAPVNNNQASDNGANNSDGDQLADDINNLDAFGGSMQAAETVNQNAVPILTSHPNQAALSRIEGDKEEEFKLNPKNYFPAGGFCKAVSLGGADASTSTTAQSDTTPILFKIVDDCILPNEKHSSLKGALVTASVYGEISSERGIVRTQHLSVYLDDELLDIPIEGTAFDLTGKNGMRGDLILRNDKILMAAGISGVLNAAGAVAQATSQTYSVSPLGNTSTVDGSNVLPYMAGAGVSKSADILSNYYVDLANQYSPIVSVNAGSVVTLVMLKGFPLRNQKAIQKYINSVNQSRVAQTGNSSSPIPLSLSAQAMGQNNQELNPYDAMNVNTKAQQFVQENKGSSI
jgi:conjugal transfer pilus assembly protein TraB